MCLVLLLYLYIISILLSISWPTVRSILPTVTHLADIHMKHFHLLACMT